MGDFTEFSAKNKSEAITKACIELGVSSDQLEIQVVSEGSSGFFGIGSKPAIIKARRIEDDSIDKELRHIVETVSASSLSASSLKDNSNLSDENRKNTGKEEKKNKSRGSRKEENADFTDNSVKKQDKGDPSEADNESEEVSAPAVKKKSSGKKNERRQDKKGADRNQDESKTTGKVSDIEAVEARPSGKKTSRRKSEGEAPDNTGKHVEAEDPISVEEFEERRENRNKGRYRHDRSRGSKDYDRRNREKRNAYSEASEEGAEDKDFAEDTTPKPPKPSKPIKILTDPAQIAEVESRAAAFLQDVFGCMDLGEVKITSQYNSEEGSLDVEFEGEDMGMLIGKRGQTLDSLQYLTSLVVNKGSEDYVRVKLDTEDYRRRRKETLENLARGIAYKVKKTRRPVVLEPMNPYERRIIHSALQCNKYVETMSEGEEPYRHVVVKMKKF